MEQPIHSDTASSDTASNDISAAPRDLRAWLEVIDRAGELTTITAPVAAEEELGAITYMVSRDSRASALLFENVTGGRDRTRVLSNMLSASTRRYAMAIGADPALSTTALIDLTRARMKGAVAPVTVEGGDAPVNQSILRGDDIDLSRLAVPKFWPKDGGPYIGTGDVTFTRDPANGRINVGCYRQMLVGPRQVAIHFSPGKHGLLDIQAWWRQGRPCEVVVAFGIDPVLFMVSSQTYSATVSEMEIAGALSGVPVALTAGVATSLPIPARAEIVIEGRIRPGVTAVEGPLGEFTGYYGSPAAPEAVIEVDALHMRRDPIMTAAMMADYPSCEIGAYYAIMKSAAVWDSLDQLGVPGITGVWADPAAAAGWGMLVVSVRQQYPGHVAQVLALAAQCPAAAYYTKWVIAVDHDVDPTDINQVLWAMSTRCSPMDDIDVQRDTWATKLDPSRFVTEDRPYGSKALIDACMPHKYLSEFPERTAIRRTVHDRVAGRWAELGLAGAPPRLPTLLDEN